MCWLTLLLWVTQPFALGPLIADALQGVSGELSNAALKAGSVAAWVLWLVVLVSLAVRLPVSLTVARIGLGNAFLLSVWAATFASQTLTVVLGIAVSLSACATALVPGVADCYINGASYGEEKRFVLRAPGPVLLFFVVPACMIVFFGATGGLLLLLNQVWFWGVLATVGGLPSAVLAFNALYRLTDRFIVFVPNGLVLHDRNVLREPVLLSKRDLVGLAPAEVDTNATDLTASALGLALEVKLRAPIKLSLVSGRNSTEEHQIKSLLISPSCPADVMQTAKQRGITVA